MLRNLVGFCVLACITGCLEPSGEEELRESAAELGSVTRERVTGDLYHYEWLARLGAGPNGSVRVHRIVRERAPWVPRATPAAALLMHGDFATFETNFAPALGEPASPVMGLAPYLAARNIDVWGVDRRWAVAGAGGDLAGFEAMGVAQEIDDVRAVLALARAIRLAGGSGAGPLALVGFSHGAQLAYSYAAVEAARPQWQRHASGVVALDFYAALGPAEEALRVAACASSRAAYQAVADGVIDSPNDFLISVGELARSAPDDASPFFETTNRGAMLITVGQTYLFAPLAPLYHLLSPVLAGELPTALRETSEAAATAWLAGATPHQALLEAADFDALLCGEAPPLDAPLSRIRVPVLYLGAAGGVGTLGLYTTTQVGSRDVTARVVQRFPADRRGEDFGHADLLFADDAPALAWKPIADWIASRGSR